MKFLLNGQETERLIFRLLETTDFDIWVDLFKEPDAARFLGMEKIKTPEECCKTWFEKIEHRYQNDLGGMNVLIDKKTNEFIGQCGLLVQEVDGIQELEVGYSILPKHRNKGYASEAAIKCRDFAFEKKYTDFLISIIHIENIKSEIVARKNGMIKTKQTIFREMPVNIYGITRKEWLKLK